ncbi:MAG: HAD family hydrolase [Acidothermaceae bacterium]
MSATRELVQLPLRQTAPAAVLFDMDGLLIDTEPLWFAVESEILSEFGASWTHDDHAHLLGSSAPVASAFIAERSNGRATPHEIADLLVVHMSKKLRDTPPLQPGVRELIDEIDDAGIPRALVSSSARVLIDAVLEGVAPLTFDVIVAGDAVTRNKPHPEPYLTAAAMLGVEASDCIAFEDSPTGAQSATAAGCMVIAVPSVTAISPAPRRIVVASVDQVDLAFMRSLFAIG